MKLFPVLAVTLVSTAYAQQPDAKKLVEQSIANYQHDWRTGMSWAYTQTDITRSDNVKEVDVSEIAPLDGTPYERLIMKDGEKLTPEEQRRQERKYQKVVEEREQETPSERATRIRKYEEQRAFLGDIPKAYDFRLLGDETVDGRSAWVVQLTPRPDFVPEKPHASMLEHIEGKLWIDKEDVQWAKADARVIDTISIGWIMARVSPPAHIVLQQTRVADRLWLPKEISISGEVRVFLVHRKPLDEKLTYSGYHQAGAISAGNRNPLQSSAPRHR